MRKADTKFIGEAISLCHLIQSSQYVVFYEFSGNLNALYVRVHEKDELHKNGYDSDPIIDLTAYLDWDVKNHKKAMISSLKEFVRTHLHNQIQVTPSIKGLQL